MAVLLVTRLWLLASADKARAVPLELKLLLAVREDGEGEVEEKNKKLRR